MAAGRYLEFVQEAKNLKWNCWYLQQETIYKIWLDLERFLNWRQYNTAKHFIHSVTNIHHIHAIIHFLHTPLTSLQSRECVYVYMFVYRVYIMLSI